MACDRFLVLCEDRRHESFIRTWLQTCGLDYRRVYVKLSPSGNGAAENFVRREYPARVQLLRSKAHQENLGLIVMIDGDGHDPADRKQQLDEALAHAGIKKRSQHDKICILVPSRNIETWVHYLMTSGEVDEKDDYKHHVSNQQVRNAGELFQGYREANLTEPPSLNDSLIERQRVGR